MEWFNRCVEACIAITPGAQARHRKLAQAEAPSRSRHMTWFDWRVAHAMDGWLGGLPSRRRQLMAALKAVDASDEAGFPGACSRLAEAVELAGRHVLDPMDPRAMAMRPEGDLCDWALASPRGPRALFAVFERLNSMGALAVACGAWCEMVGARQRDPEADAASMDKEQSRALERSDAAIGSLVPLSRAWSAVAGSREFPAGSAEALMEGMAAERVARSCSPDVGARGHRMRLFGSLTRTASACDDAFILALGRYAAGNVRPSDDEGFMPWLLRASEVVADKIQIRGAAGEPEAAGQGARRQGRRI